MRWAIFREGFHQRRDLRLTFAAFSDGLLEFFLQAGELAGRQDFFPDQCRVFDGFERRQENRLLVGDGFPITLMQQAEQGI